MSHSHVLKLSQSMYILERLSEFTWKTSFPMSAATNLRDAEPNGSMLQDTGAFRFIADRARSDVLVDVGEILTGGTD